MRARLAAGPRRIRLAGPFDVARRERAVRQAGPYGTVGATHASPAPVGRGRPGEACLAPTRTALLLALPLLFPALAPAEEARLAASAAPAQVHVGEEVTISFDLSFPPGSEFEPPQGVKLEGLELKRHEPAQERRDRDGKLAGVVYRYVAVGFETGEFTIPPAEAKVLVPGASEPATLKSEPVKVAVASILKEGEKDLRDIQPPVERVERNAPLLYGLAALALLALGAALGRFLARRRRPRAETPAAPAAPPDLRAPEQWARDELARVEALGLALKTDDASLKDHAFLVTEVLRGYLGRKFSFPSLELTTEELSGELRARGQLHADLEAYLAETDVLKFARPRAARTEVQELAARTRALVDAVFRREEEARRRWEEARAREAERARAAGGKA